MDSSKIFYLLSVCANGALYYFGKSWIHPEDTFSWARLVFLVAMLLLMDKYVLVPQPLSCPPFYMFYKMVAAVIVANISLVTVWYQMEDFLQWILASLASLFEFVPMVNKKLAFGENATVVATTQVLVAVYFFFWVITSGEYNMPVMSFFRLRKSSYLTQNAQSVPGRRRRSPPTGRR